MATLFISHASDDKKALEPLVLRLLDRLLPADHQVWIDLPERVSSDPRLSNSPSILYGSKWSDAIEDAVQSGGCIVLFVWTKNTNKRFSKHNSEDQKGTLQWEMNTALKNNSFMGVLLQGEMSDVPEVAQASHWCNLSDWDPSAFHGEFEKLLRTVENRMQEADVLFSAKQNQRLARLDKRSEDISPSSMDTEFLLHSVDRKKQEIAVKKHVQSIYDSRSAQPLIIVGPTDEEPHAFLRQIFRTANEKYASNGVMQIQIDWPNGATFETEYLEQISLEFGLPLAASRSVVANKLASLPQLTILWTLLSSERWNSSQIENMRVWLNMWINMSALTDHGLQVLPVICIKLPTPGKPWYHPDEEHPMPPNSSASLGPAPKRIWQDLDGLISSVGLDVESVRAPILTPILQDDADMWAARRDVGLSGPDPRSKRARDIIEALFLRKSNMLRFFSKLPPQSPIRVFCEALFPIVDRRDDVME